VGDRPEFAGDDIQSERRQRRAIHLLGASCFTEYP
jgi:hypothetical protein